jgi:hypothetical protein
VLDLPKPPAFVTLAASFEFADPNMGALQMNGDVVLGNHVCSTGSSLAPMSNIYLGTKKG